MDPILPALVAGGLFAGGYVYSRWRSRYWRGVVEQCDLHVTKVSGWAWNLALQGQAGPLEIRIAGSLHNKSGTQVVVVIPGPRGFSEVSIRREDQTPWKTREIEVGSESFDRTFFVEGPVRLVLALLDAETRNLLISADDVSASVGSRLEIVGGELLADTVDHQLPLILPLLIGIAKRFARPVDVGQRLAQNATHDPEAGVRLKNLLLLIRELPGHGRTLKVLHAACSDPSPEVRLQAGRALGAQGHGVLVELAENLEDDAVSAQAVSILARELPFESMQAILFRAMRGRSPQTAQACLEALSRRGDASAIGVLVEVMEHEKGEPAVFAARALERAGSPNAEGPLILALQREQADLRVAAANALGRVGSVAAVLPLQEAAERYPRDPELSRATHQAIAEIQSRLQGASPGQLSLAGAEAGQLSLAQAEAGQLSIATDPAGQLSLGGADDKPEEA